MFELIGNLTSPTLKGSSNFFEGRLDLINSLLDVLHNSQILYCHWKSNEHLGASMLGNTDLDILFDVAQKERLEILLKSLHFKKFNPIQQKQYKDIEDFIGLDLPSGKIVHLHAHFKLTMGEAYLKSYQLKFEDKVLKSRFFDETHGIYCIDPSFELILLYFREALKIKNRDIISMYLRNKINLKYNIIAEYNWLRLRTTESQIEISLKQIINDPEKIRNFILGDFDRKQLDKLSVLLKKEFKSHRMLLPFQALILRWYNEVSILVYKKVSKFLNQPIVIQRVNPDGGLIVAFIGADGSGKSTVINNLHSTLGKKLDVFRLYFGRGRAGGISWQRKPIVGMKRMLTKAKIKNKYKQGELTIDNKKAGFKRNIIKCIEALLVANEKRKKIKLMTAAKEKGMLVICDRFPQNQLMGYNDGPVLNDLSKSFNPFFKVMAKIEAHLYSKSLNHHPDIVFKLIADARTIDARKPSKATIKMLETKVEGIKKLEFAHSCKVITIDATQPLDEVLYKVKKELWEVLSQVDH